MRRFLALVRYLIGLFYPIRRALPWRPAPRTITRLYLWRVYVKGQPRGFKVREVVLHV